MSPEQAAQPWNVPCQLPPWLAASAMQAALEQVPLTDKIYSGMIGECTCREKWACNMTPGFTGAISMLAFSAVTSMMCSFRQRCSEQMRACNTSDRREASPGPGPQPRCAHPAPWSLRKLPEPPAASAAPAAALVARPASALTFLQPSASSHVTFLKIEGQAYARV